MNPFKKALDNLNEGEARTLAIKAKDGAGRKKVGISALKNRKERDERHALATAARDQRRK